AFLLHRDARPAGPCPAAHGGARTAPAAGRAERRGGHAAAPGGAGAEVQGGIRHRLRRRTARLRGRRAQGRRRRLRAHAAAGRAGQGPQGSPCHAVAATAREIGRASCREGAGRGVQRCAVRILRVEEVTLLLQAAPGPKYRAAFATAYGAGLRVSEVVALKAGDVDSERMLLPVEQGKGRKDRRAMLSPQLLELLRAWWREGRRPGVLLPRGS